MRFQVGAALHCSTLVVTLAVQLSRLLSGMLCCSRLLPSLLCCSMLRFTHGLIMPTLREAHLLLCCPLLAAWIHWLPLDSLGRMCLMQQPCACC